MAFDNSKPAGNDPIADGDDAIRANNTAIQGAVDLEHDFADADGAQQTGRHKFEITNILGAGSLLAPSPVDGSIALDDTTRTGRLALTAYRGGSWEGVVSGDTTAPLTDEQNQWEAAQLSGLTNITTSITGTGDGAALQLDLADGAYQHATIPVGVTTLTVVGFVADVLPLTSTTINLELTQNAAGNVVLNWGSDFVASNGIKPVMGPSSNLPTLFQITRLSTGSLQWLVTSLPDIKGLGAF
jgi:hypothetical protein